MCIYMYSSLRVGFSILSIYLNKIINKNFKNKGCKKKKSAVRKTNRPFKLDTEAVSTSIFRNYFNIIRKIQMHIFTQ